MGIDSVGRSCRVRPSSIAHGRTRQERPTGSIRLACNFDVASLNDLMVSWDIVFDILVN